MCIYAQLLVWPFFEYTLHYFLHRVHSARHQKHHQLQTTESFLFAATTLALFYLSGLLGFVLGWIAYFGVHWVSHHCPSCLPALSNHHLLHHRRPNKNFGVTTTFIDELFGTKYTDEASVRADA